MSANQSPIGHISHAEDKKIKIQINNQDDDVINDQLSHKVLQHGSKIDHPVSSVAEIAQSVESI